MRKKDPNKLPNPVNYSLWLLNYKPKSVKEMTAALLKRGFDEDTSKETVASLLRWGYLNDESYKEYVIKKRKQHQPKGRSFVLHELREAGIDCDEEIDDLYTDEEEQQLILKLLRQWCKGGKSFTENRDRFFQRLYRRGFSSRNIGEIFHEFEDLEEIVEFEQFPEKDTD